MRKFFTGFFLLIQFQVFAQAPEVAIPDSATIPKLVKLTPLVRKSQEFIKVRLTKAPSRELKILGRSAIVISAVSAAGGATYAFGDEPLRDFMLTNRNEITQKVSGFIEPLGRSQYMIFVSGGFYGAGLMVRNPKLQRTGILVDSSLLLNDMVTGQLKDEFQRRRPDVTAHNHFFEGGEGGRHHASFPSSHTSTAFTFATSVATIYKDSKWIPPLAYGTATLVGLSRIHDNKHWATDVLAGAAVGFTTAKFTNLILTQVEKQLEKKGINIYVMPRVSSGTAGLNMGVTF